MNPLAWVVYALRGLAWTAGELIRRRRRPPAWIGFLVEGPPPQLPPPRGPVWRRFIAPRPTSLLEIGEQLRRVATDSRTAGIVLQLRPMALTPAQSQALSGLLAELRAGGKRVICWATSYSAATYAVAVAADQILIAPGGEIAPLGVARTHLHLKAALERIGVRADLLQVSPYKTAGDVLTTSRMTPEAAEMEGWLADSALADLVEAVAAGRRLDDGAARRLVSGSPYTDEQSVAAGAVDAIETEEQLATRLEGGWLPYQDVRRRLRRPPPARPGPVVGLLRVEGVIVDGRSRRAPVAPPLPLPLLFENQAGDLSVVAEARRLADSRRVGAAVLWVDSGGGSATASFAMAAALEHLAARKPLVVAMGSLAASGGYAVAAPGRLVFAQPGTLTGSIGVIGGKVVVGGLLDRLLVGRTPVERGGRMRIQSPDRPYTPQDRKWLRAAIMRSYALFLDEVARGRHTDRAKVEPVAGGRVWTGRQALDRGLVDRLGGLEGAAAEARRLAGLRPDAPLREPRPSRGVPPAGAGGAMVQAMDLLRGLNRASAWWLCPYVSWDS